MKDAVYILILVILIQILVTLSNNDRYAKLIIKFDQWLELKKEGEK